MSNIRFDEYNWKDEALQSVQKRKKMIEDLIKAKTASLKKAPEGALKVVDKKTYYQYYLRADPKDTTGVYIPKRRRSFARQLAQRDYDRCVLQEAQKELALVSEYADYLSTESLANIFDNFNPGKRALIEPVYTDDDRFMETWRSEEYPPFEFGDSTSELYTKSGVRVRSKSELIIADMLEQYRIPYRYEYPLVLKDNKTVRPDFLCLNVKEHKEYIWEHFGMMDNIAYANSNVNKIAAYELSGYQAGENMIMTFETSQTPMSSKIIKNKIQQYLL